MSHGRTRKGPPLARPVSGRPDASPFAGVDVAPEDLTRLHDEVSGGSVLGNSALVAGNVSLLLRSTYQILLSLGVHVACDRRACRTELPLLRCNRMRCVDIYVMIGPIQQEKG